MTSSDHAHSNALWRRALAVIPAGTQTFSKGPSQFVNGVAPKYLARGKGCQVWDVDGHSYIDYGMALGPVILGYGYDRVDDAIRKQLENGISFTLMHPLEVEVSELMASIVPCCEMVRFGKNGSDATAGAIRLARAVTGRDVIACCGYHGWQDWYIGSTSRASGVPAAVRGLVKPFRYNDIDSLDRIFAAEKDRVAAVIMEPVNFTPPNPGFLESVKELAHRHGALLIFDEVITGFRMAIGGAQEFFNVTPDLATFGKALGNGMPISAIAGRAEYMRRFEEVFFSFTFGGETLSLAAAQATLTELRDRNVPRHIAANGACLRDAFNALCAARGIASQARCIGLDYWPEFEFFDQDQQPSPVLGSLFVQEIVKRGILTRAGLFLCYSHTPEIIEATLGVFGEALTVVAEAIHEGDAQRRLEGDVISPILRSTL